MDAVQAATLRTIIYADIFNFALRPDEIHRYLLHDVPISLDEVHQAICSPALQTLIQFDDKYVALYNNDVAIPRRYQTEQHADHLWKQASRYAGWLAAIPFVEMLALTGALAMRNPGGEKDDFDYLIVTRPGRVWFVRACAVMLVWFGRLFGDEICPNYILASDQLSQKRRDLFIAHEIAQMRPLFGWHIYQQMLENNKWVCSMLANVEPFPAHEDSPYKLKILLEKLLGGYIGNFLDRWEYWRRGEKLKTQAKNPQSAAIINQAQIKGHFQDHGTLILEQYEKRLREYDLLAT